ncbi:MAG: hypothetical protein QXG03_07740 [Halalkalicoccus sp.]
MRAPVAAVLALCIVTVIGGAVLGAGSAMAQSDDALVEPDNASQTIEIQLDEEGNANVSVYKQFTLESDEDRAAFDRLADEFENGEASDELSDDVFERIAANAANETGREMEISDVERGTEATSSTGTLRLEFTWTGFAEAEDGELRVGDVFTVDGETWLPTLSDDQRLVIRAPEGYAVGSVEPETAVSDGALAWEGPTAFDTGEPEAVFVPSNQVSDGFSLLTVGLGLGVVAAIVLLTYVVSRRRADAPLLPTAVADDRGWATLLAPAADRPQEQRTPLDEGSDRNPEPDPFDDVDEELLSDEERVLRLLEANDGRMKQATIVTETDWSNAKVSQLLSAMEEAGEIEKLRIGRENLITLREEE